MVTNTDESARDLPEILTADDLTITVRLPAKGKWRRWLLAYHDGNPHVSVIPDGRVIMTPRQILNTIATSPDELGVTYHDLVVLYASMRRMVHDRARYFPERRDMLKRALCIS